MTEPDLRQWPVGQTGYVAVVGRPNVGKSTLLNAILGAHLLAVSPLPQTTRRHWRGILSDATSQIIFIDTPGAHVGNTTLNRAMLDSALSALTEADVNLCLADPTRPCGAEDALIAGRVAEAGKPTVLGLNKSDLATPGETAAAKAFFLERLGADTPIFEFSAQTEAGVPELVTYLRAQLPTGPFMFPPDQAMDAMERELGAEIIREAALHLLREEVPHAVTVAIDQWTEGPKRLKIAATLFVERESQKAIVIGKGGAMLADIRRHATTLLVEWLEQHLTLNLHVKVAQDWRNRASFLREHGLLPEE